MTFEGNCWRLRTHLLLWAYPCLLGDTTTTGIFISICCLVTHVHATKVKGNEVYERKGWGWRRANLWSSIASDPPSGFCLAFYTLHFAFPDPLHSHQLASVLPIVCSSHGTEAFEGQGHLQVELATRRAYDTSKLSQIMWLVASWETGKETSEVKKIEKK